jgi:hypothetical protein
MFLFILIGLVFLPFGFAQTPLDKGLVALYPFQGSAGDASPNSNSAEVLGASLTEGHDGQAESAYSLDGIDDYLVIPHSKSLSLYTRVTFGLWWKHEPQASQDEYYTLFEKIDPERGGHSHYGMWLIGDHAEVCTEAPDNSAQSCLDSTGALEKGWHHLAASYDGTTLRIYLDGELSSERTVEPSGISQSNFEMFVGTDHYAPAPIYTRGVIDELPIYNQALSRREIAAGNQAP